jgi:hypothetical protein
MKKELEGNRAYRRKKEAIERSRKPVPKYLSSDWAERKRLIALKVANKIAKVKASKAKRLAKQEADGIVMKKNDKKKLSQAEQRQIRRKAKIIKFLNKLKQ